MGKEDHYAVSRSCGRHLRAQGLCSGWRALRHPRKPCRKIRSGTHQGGRALRRRRCVHHQQGLRRTHQGGPCPPEGRLCTGDPREQRQRQHLRRQRRGSGRRMLRAGGQRAGHRPAGRAARLHRRHRSAHGHRPLCPGHSLPPPQSWLRTSRAAPMPPPPS